VRIVVKVVRIVRNVRISGENEYVVRIERNVRISGEDKYVGGYCEIRVVKIIYVKREMRREKISDKICIIICISLINIIVYRVIWVFLSDFFLRFVVYFYFLRCEM
jgi:hypothetical protein